MVIIILSVICFILFVSLCFVLYNNLLLDENIKELQFKIRWLKQDIKFLKINKIENPERYLKSIFLLYKYEGLSNNLRQLIQNIPIESLNEGEVE